MLSSERDSLCAHEPRDCGCVVGWTQEPVGSPECFLVLYEETVASLESGQSTSLKFWLESLTVPEFLFPVSELEAGETYSTLNWEE